MADEVIGSGPGSEPSPFERIRRVNEAGNEHWSSRDFAKVLGHTDYRNFEQVIDKAKIACFNSGQRLDDPFVDVTEMVEIGKRRPSCRHDHAGLPSAESIKKLESKKRKQIGK
ncbi:MAG TPA: BRO family protein [Tepidisphaeraceae bacterium]|nr:BRO family protein [Tepidisphaeraceae bacterium]